MLRGRFADRLVDDQHENTIRQGPKRLAWLDFLRALAVLLVLWGHLVGEFLASRALHWGPADILASYIFEPLIIRQSGGFLGVCIFFLISGYIIARIIGKESALQFAVRRFLRIFPLIFIVALSVWLLGRFGLPGLPAGAYIAPFIEVIKNTFLINYIASPQIILVGPAWSLVVEVCFYILALILLPQLRHRKLHPVALPIAMLATTGLSSVWARSLGDNFFLLAVSLAYLPILAMGSLFYLYESRQITATQCGIIGAISWVVFLSDIAQFYPQFKTPTINSYPVSVMIAVCLFLLVFMSRHKIEQLPTAINWVALVSYSIYLWHGVIALPMESMLLPLIGFNASLLISLISLIGIAQLSYRLIEKPLQVLAKKIC